MLRPLAGQLGVLSPFLGDTRLQTQAAAGAGAFCGAPELELPTISRGLVPSEFVPDAVAFRGDYEVAPTTPPVEMVANIPDDYAQGQSLALMGPHGPIEVMPPPGSEAGSKLRFRLSPPPEFTLTVPPGAEEGSYLRVRKPNGEDVAVAVPQGLKPGDTFEVVPPAVMVRVPASAQPGDFIIFRRDQEWRRARVPEGSQAGVYIAATVPF